MTDALLPVAPPQNLEAEQSVLGAVLLADVTLATVLDEKLEPRDFYRSSHGRIYAAMLDLNAAGDGIDRLTLIAHLQRTGHLGEIGGPAAVEALAGAVPAIGNLRQYARIVRETAAQRRLQRAIREWEESVNGSRAEAEEELARVLAENRLSSVSHATDWLDGEPMDPAAEIPEPAAPLAGFPFLYEGGGAAMMVGPTGGGRSTLVETSSFDGAEDGLSVAMLSGEVTGPEFNARAADIARRRGRTVDEDLRQKLSGVRFLSLSTVIQAAWRDPQQWVESAGSRFDVIVLDPLSSVASALDMDFDTSNAEFARFYDTLVQPLVARGVWVVMLDNVGHSIEARSRAKGASAKSDRVDLTFWCKVEKSPAGLTIVADKVRSIRAPHRKGDAWTFDRETLHIRPALTENRGDVPFKPTEIMERVSRLLEDEPGLSRNSVQRSVKGKGAFIDLALELLIAEGFVGVERDGQTKRHNSVKPYRVPESQPSPTGSQDPVAITESPSPGPYTGTRDPVAMALEVDQ